jgi:prevent-host-death family protein
MSAEKIPINEFRARTAEILRTIKETKASYILTSRGEPVAEVVPYGTPIRRRGKPLLGIFEVEDYTRPWDEEGISEREYEDRERAARIQEEERRHKKLQALLGWDDEDGEPAG